MSFNLATILRESARRVPDHPALVAGEEQVPYHELDRRSDAVASALGAAGLRPGDVVGLQLPNLPEFVVSLYGILKAGGVVLPMNPLNRAAEIHYMLADSAARFLVTTDSCAPEALEAVAQAGAECAYVVGAEVEHPDARPFAALLERPIAEPEPFVQRDPGDTAILLYTSGTTGRPKGVQLTHFQLYMNAAAHDDAFEMTDRSVVLAVMPLFHALGLSGILNATIRQGGTAVLLPKFDARRALEAIAAHGVTILHGVPTMYHSLLDFPDLDSFDTGTLSKCGSAGAAIAAETIDAFESRFGVQILEMYGLTESGPLASYNRPDDRKPYSIGKPIPGVEIEVWDESHHRLPRGAQYVGEMVIRGHNTMSGYLNNPEATDEAFTNGWLHTGDLAYRDEDGFLFFVDRKKELIIRGGYNVYPREVEEVLYQHPAVYEVAVVGVPDPRLGEEIAAFVTVKPGASVEPAELIEFVKERVAAYKYPRQLEIIEEMPKSATNKILKKILVQR